MITNNMKDIKDILTESVMEHLIQLKMTPSELLTMMTLIDINGDENLEQIRNKIVVALKPNITKLLRKYNIIGQKYDYKTIFDKKNHDEAESLFKLIKDEEEKFN